MSQQTNIEWCDSTFNPWIGCSKVSPACDDCYAARSTPARTLGAAWGPQAVRHHTSPANWAQPRRWNAKRFMQCKACGWRGELAAELIGCGACGSTDHLQDARRRVFCASLADVFDNAVPVQWRIELMRLIMETPNLDWLLLTKRIGNAAVMLETAFRGYRGQREGWQDNVPPHVWIGVTVCNQAEADRDIPKLLAVPAAKRFLSIEPMLGAVYLTAIPISGSGHHEFDPIITVNVLKRAEAYPPLPHVNWVICGGESGPSARPMRLDWVQSLRDQCEAAGVPFLFKQWGEWAPARQRRTVAGPVLIVEGVAPFKKNPKWHQWPDGAAMARIGKPAAGRMLDGRQHDGVPS